MAQRLVRHRSKTPPRRCAAAALRMQQRARRRRLDDGLAENVGPLTRLAHRLQAAREDERARLARDLHDELGSMLTAAQLDVARLRTQLTDRTPLALARLDHLVGVLRGMVSLKQRITEDLWPSALAHLGLVDTLTGMARDFAQRSGLRVHCRLQPVGLSATAELVAYRLVQEAITNISKHARARQVWLTLAPRRGRVQVVVRDDGVGCLPRRAGGEGFGLMGMRVRVQAENGELQVRSAPGRGTRVQAWLPCSGPLPVRP